MQMDKTSGNTSDLRLLKINSPPKYAILTGSTRLQQILLQHAVLMHIQVLMLLAECRVAAHPCIVSLQLYFVLSTLISY